MRIIISTIIDMLRFRFHRMFLEEVDPDKISSFKESVSIAQRILPGRSYMNKVHNLKLASKNIDYLIIYPGQIFSFWKNIKEASEKKGYLESRTLVNNRISSSIGGGLCQLSGIIYHLSLVSGMEIIERHNHSTDIYREDERYTPLGADAAVVYGYKDLKIRNPHEFPVVLNIIHEENGIIASFLSKEKIIPYDVEFSINMYLEYIDVTTTRMSKNQKLNICQVNRYEKIEEPELG